MNDPKKEEIKQVHKERLCRNETAEEEQVFEEYFSKFEVKEKYDRTRYTGLCYKTMAWERGV